jgi:hypothetical protein
MWASLRPSNPAILLGGEGPVLGVSRETFFSKTGLFSPDCFRNLKANAEKQFVPPFQDGRKGVKMGRIGIRCSEGVR